MTERRLILIGGGVRSGKSAFALRRARQLGQRRAFIATAQAFDDEMRARIDAHRRERADEFETHEEPLALARCLSQIDAEVVVIDCLTLWLSNLLLAEWTEAQILEALDEFSACARARNGAVLVVTTEVGLGVVPETRLGRVFRDMAGLAHQRLSADADEIYAGLLGCIVRLHPAPLRLERA
jgi:adenosylcobinamide kinase / adenosylcobinamide-phosphate guanylyltransferase